MGLVFPAGHRRESRMGGTAMTATRRTKPKAGGQRMATVLGPAGPTPAEILAKFPQWHRWTGVSGLLYAARQHSSPPIVVRAPDVFVLLGRMRAEEDRLRP